MGLVNPGELAAVRVDRRDDVVLVGLQGEVDLANVDDVRHQVLAALSPEAHPVVLDLTETSYLDSAGIRMLFDLSERLTAQQCSFRLVVPESGLVRRVLGLTGVTGHIPTFETVAEAISSSES